MSYYYYPGCSLKDKDRGGKMEETALTAARVLNIELQEIEDWQCCGAVYPLTDDELISLLPPARTLAAAAGKPLITLCAACFHVLKRTRERLNRDRDARDKITAYLSGETFSAGSSFPGKAADDRNIDDRNISNEEKLNVEENIFRSEVLHFLELLAREPGFAALARMVKNPLQGRKVACYYGCLLLRPAAEMKFDHPAAPVIMEDFIKALGGEPVRFFYGTECCGAYLSLTEQRVVDDTSARICAAAAGAGADTVITSCPLCQYNLQQAAPVKGLKIQYFTELLAEALHTKPAAIF